MFFLRVGVGGFNFSLAFAGDLSWLFSFSDYRRSDPPHFAMCLKGVQAREGKGLGGAGAEFGVSDPGWGERTPETAGPEGQPGPGSQAPGTVRGRSGAAPGSARLCGAGGESCASPPRGLGSGAGPGRRGPGQVRGGGGGRGRRPPVPPGRVAGVGREKRVGKAVSAAGLGAPKAPPGWDGALGGTDVTYVRPVCGKNGYGGWERRIFGKVGDAGHGWRGAGGGCSLEVPLNVGRKFPGQGIWRPASFPRVPRARDYRCGVSGWAASGTPKPTSGPGDGRGARGSAPAHPWPPLLGGGKVRCCPVQGTETRPCHREA